MYEACKCYIDAINEAEYVAKIISTLCGSGMAYFLIMHGCYLTFAKYFF